MDGTYRVAVSEQWHLQYFLGDVVPPAVLAFEAANHPKPPPSTEDFMLGLIDVDNDPAWFVGWCDSAGHFIQVEWVQTPMRLQAFQDAGATTFPFPKTALVTCTLLGPVPPGYGKSDFAAVIGAA